LQTQRRRTRRKKRRRRRRRRTTTAAAGAAASTKTKPNRTTGARVLESNKYAFILGTLRK
jgi:hypothetical protein